MEKAPADLIILQSEGLNLTDTFYCVGQGPHAKTIFVVCVRNLAFPQSYLYLTISHYWSVPIDKHNNIIKITPATDPLGGVKD